MSRAAGRVDWKCISAKEHFDMRANDISFQPVASHCVLCVSEDVLVEENQSSSVSLPGLMTPSSAAGMSLSMEMPRKRKGSMDNQWVWVYEENLINPLTQIDASDY